MSDQARRMLTEVVNKVPASINSASVGRVREWKSLNTKAQKALESSRTSDSILLSLFSQLTAYK